MNKLDYFLGSQFCDVGSENIDFRIPPQSSEDSTITTFENGFPYLMQVKQKDGGVVVKRLDFNGILRVVTNLLTFLNKGGRFTFNEQNVDGYDMGAILYCPAAKRDVISLKDNNRDNFNININFIDGKSWQYLDAYQPQQVPPGKICYFATITPPLGYLVGDGSAVSRTVYAALFAAIGTKYGAGDGVNTFNLPDLRGIWIRGSGTNSKIAGASSLAMGQYQAGAYQNHSHQASLSTNPHGHGDSGHTHNDDHEHTLPTTTPGTGSNNFPQTISGPSRYDSARTNSKSASGYGSTTQTSYANIVAATVTGTVTVNNSTSGADENRVANTAMLGCIKY